MEQCIVNEEGFKGPSEADQKVIDDAKKHLDLLGANPEAKEFKPKNSSQDLPVKTPIVYIKNLLVVYKEEAKNITCPYCLANALPNHQPSVWTKCKDNSDLNNSYEVNVSTKMSGASFDNTYWPEEVDHMDLAPYSYEEYYPEYLAPASPGNSSSSSNAYWVEWQEVAQMELTNPMTHKSYYNQTTYFSLNEKQVDNVWLEQNTEDYSSPLQSSPGFWFNDTLYF